MYVSFCCYSHGFNYCILSEQFEFFSQAVEKMSGCGPVVVFLRVPGLPRGACVEWTFTAHTSSSSPLHREHLPLVATPPPSPPPGTVSSQLKQGVGLLSSEEVTWSDGGACAAGAWLFSLRELSNLFLYFMKTL